VHLSGSGRTSARLPDGGGLRRGTLRCAAGS